MRRKRSFKSSQRQFARTANKTKKINVNPTIYRGGIRL